MNMHTGKTPKLQSHPEPGTGRVLGSPRAALGNSHAQESPAETFAAAGTPSPNPRTASLPTGWCPLASRQTEATWKQDKVERGLSCQDSWGWALGAEEGVSQCGPHSVRGARHKDSNSDTEKQ